MDAEVSYVIYAKEVDAAIDMKNKILSNTIEKEKVRIKIHVNSDYILV
ncbi:hypothetical protein [Streptococcus ruminantium]|nr:hypothetical protein [Streptococcus ruminantium]